MVVDAEQGLIARYAFSWFGKGRHAAGLDFGDCFAYALARVLGEPLLFKGCGFRTDRRCNGRLTGVPSQTGGPGR